MTDLPLKGVEFNAPPPTILAAMLKQVDAQVAQLPPDADGALVAVATERGVNAAFVARMPHGFEVVSWVGRTWGSQAIDAGAGVKKVFRWR